MTEKKKRCDLKEVILLLERGIIDPEHEKSWNEFKKTWSEEDLKFWNGYMDKLVGDNLSNIRLKEEPSAEEKEWAKKFHRRAEEFNVC